MSRLIRLKNGNISRYICRDINCQLVKESSAGCYRYHFDNDRLDKEGWLNRADISRTGLDDKCQLSGAGCELIQQFLMNDFFTKADRINKTVVPSSLNHRGQKADSA